MRSTFAKLPLVKKVRISLDSDPSKELTGNVTSVANVGEQRPNTDAKVFEVRIVVAEADTTLRPGMTTGNAIETFSEDDVLSIPIEALNSDDGIPYVYRQDGGSVVKQEVVTGAMGENEVMILTGLTEDDRVLLTPPGNRDDLTLRRLPDSPVAPPGVGGDTAQSVEIETAPQTNP